tara:strand:- start:3764 stop:3970 length:207 start_codon:yes stop_codon:yes gene_type:complete
MNPDDYLNEAQKRYLNSDYMVKVKEYTEPEDDPYNSFIYEIVTKRRETPEERKKRIHKENMKRKLKEF